MNPPPGRTGVFDPLFAQASDQQCGQDIRTLRSVVKAWDPEIFAREQVRRLVRQIFLSNSTGPVRQVVVSGTEPETDLRPVCRTMAMELARETAATVALVGSYPQIFPLEHQDQKEAVGAETIGHTTGTQIQSNLWMVPSLSSREVISTAQLISRLCNLRRDFEYSIVAAPSAGESHEPVAMAQMADGVILVLSAQQTRRATARKVKQLFDSAHVRFLGSILCDRTFPMPESLYRRL